MNQNRRQPIVNCILIVSCMTAAVAAHFTATDAKACGGFFCQQVPIDQAGEQIIFRKDGIFVTAMVLIQYTGEAEEFSWVVPVSGIPELSVGSDAVFASLETSTRPQFILETNGQRCPSDDGDFNFGGGGATSDSADDGDDGVDVLERLAVGPFDVEVITSNDAEALATWLGSNGYELTERGEELIGPYVNEGKNFVALKLRQDQGVGDIEPLIMRCQTGNATIPIRLTAVAAQDNMGVLVWLMGDSRAVPLNYLHVTPNYTRLNWYAGTFNAYASYQGLITAAMDEAGGQGFATDYAGTDFDPNTSLPTVETYTDELVYLAGFPDDADFVAELANTFVFPQDKVLAILGRELPLPEGEDSFIYSVPELLNDTFTAEQLADARMQIVVEINETIVKPLENALAMFDGKPYMTRMYTTLSADEMSLDPSFSFNPDLEDQPMTRRARMDVDCNFGATTWSLTLGEGTGRNGELVINGSGDPPGFSAPTIDQESMWRSERVDTSGPPVTETLRTFGVARVIGADSSGGSNGSACGVGLFGCGGGTVGTLLLTMFGLGLLKRRTHP
ncbi:MAG TPA: DUF2330 domain-containing protein [Phycisphaerae bacterium]|nr:DUF2330 domain-containing protein [Phycisphaerae bacterium]